MSEQKEYKIEGRPSTIFRTVKNKDNPYVMIDRRPIDNPALSFKAKGILTYLMSRPDGWEVSITDLVKHGQDGEASIRAGLKELREAGHMKYETSRNQGRITGWIIRVYEVSNPELIAQSPDSDFQQVENLQVENQDVENRTQVLKILSNTELNIIAPKKEISKPAKKGDYLDGMLALSSPKQAEMEQVTFILQEFERQLRRRDDLPGQADWQDFARGFVRKELAAGHDYRSWLNWYTSDGMRMQWAWKETPKTIKAKWMMAFSGSAIYNSVGA
jgi:hypothetical protein